jgi:hypothetical protein
MSPYWLSSRMLRQIAHLFPRWQKERPWERGCSLLLVNKDKSRRLLDICLQYHGKPFHEQLKIGMDRVEEKWQNRKKKGRMDETRQATPTLLNLEGQLNYSTLYSFEPLSSAVCGSTHRGFNELALTLK